MKLHASSTRFGRLGLLLFVFLGGLKEQAVGAGPTLVAEIDATDVSRHLLHAKIEIPLSASTAQDRVEIWYPKWIPGIHAPRGPVQNIAGFRLETPAGDRVPWRRSEEDPYLIYCQPPKGASRLVLSLDYICNQPSVNSTSIDSYANALLTVIDWNTVLCYPDGYSVDDLRIDLAVALPEGWKFGTALPVAEQKGGRIVFKTVSFREAVDSPLIAGEHFRTIDLGGERPVRMHLTSESPSALQLDEALVGQYRRLVEEAEALFQKTHYARYDFLVVCSDHLPTIGLEHLSSSLNVVGERDLVDEKKRKAWPVFLLPHEMVHSWCGKYRRPAGMWTPDYHTPKQTSLLWIYEGLTQYLGEILAVRSGLVSPEEYLPVLAYKINYLKHQTGRQWRSLEDTAISTYLLRGRSSSWGHLRRSQDYYNEGLLVWLELDAVIRERTDGGKSLDDFCHRFLGHEQTEGQIAPYELKDVYREIEALIDIDAAAWFQERVGEPMDVWPLDFVHALGYRLSYTTEPSTYLQARDESRKTLFLLDSLGMTVSTSGKILSVISDTPADVPGLAPGMVIQGVNDRKFSSQRLKDAVADSVASRRIKLLVLDGEVFKEFALNYDGGPRYLELTRDPARQDVLSEILQPRVP